jgi:hypothetical protein
MAYLNILISFQAKLALGYLQEGHRLGASEALFSILHKKSAVLSQRRSSSITNFYVLRRLETSLKAVKLHAMALYKM